MLLRCMRDVKRVESQIYELLFLTWSFLFRKKMLGWVSFGGFLLKILALPAKNDDLIQVGFRSDLKPIEALIVAQVNHLNLVTDAIASLHWEWKHFCRVHELCKAEYFHISQILGVEDFLKRALIDSAFAQIEILDR